MLKKQKQDGRYYPPEQWVALTWRCGVCSKKAHEEEEQEEEADKKRAEVVSAKGKLSSRKGTEFFVEAAR